MFPILPKVLLIIAFFITVINSTPRPDAEIFDLNPDVAPSTNIFLDGISYDDSSIPIGDQQNLFAGNPGTSESCSAEDWQSFSAIGRLRQRRGSPSGSSEGKSCIWTVAPIEESIDPDLLRLPIVDDWVEPANEGRPDICPPFVFQDRDIPLCSAEKLVTRPTLDMRDTLIQKAKACKLSFSLKDFTTARCGGVGIKLSFGPL